MNVRPAPPTLTIEPIYATPSDELCPFCWRPALKVMYGFTRLGPMAGMLRVVACLDCIREVPG